MPFHCTGYNYSRPSVEADSYRAIIMYPFPMTRLQPICRPGCPPPDSSRLGSSTPRAVQPAGRYDLSAFLNSVLFFQLLSDSYTGHSRCNGICIDGYSPSGYIAVDLRKAVSHDGQKLVITTSKRPTTWRRRYLDYSHVLGKKAIIFPSFDAGASG